MNPHYTQNINFHMPPAREDRSLRRVGIQIETQEQDTSQEDYILYNTVLGKVKDLRDFTEAQVGNWVTNHWTTHDIIQISKVGKIFFFQCSDVRDG